MPAGTCFYPNQAEVREDVLQAMLRQPIPNRSAEFHEIFDEIQRGLREVFRTERPVYIATASGTGMMEAAVRCAPRGRILATVGGAFGERFVKIAQACKREIDRHDVAAGDVPNPDEVRDLLKRGSYSALTLVHSETSTGALSDVCAIAAVARDAGVAIIVDSVSGIGGARLEFDDWRLDCAVGASQKALGLPPGLSFAVASDDFLSSASEVDDRGLYLDLISYDMHARNSETPTTPSVSLIFALAAQLREIEREGIEARWARHEAMRALVEDWIIETRDQDGIEIGILAKAGARSPTVTVVTLPSGFSAAALISEIAVRGYHVGSGYGALVENTFRIGHLGEHTVAELTGCLAAISDALRAVRQRSSS